MKKTMLKIELLLKADQRASFTDALQQLGALHLAGSEDQNNQPQTQVWKNWLELKEWLNSFGELSAAPKSQSTDEELISLAYRLKKEFSKLAFEEEELLMDKAFYKTWPDYKSQHWQALSQKGLFIELFAAKDLGKLPKDFIKLEAKNGLERATLIYRAGDKPIHSLDPVSIPKLCRKDIDLGLRETSQKRKSLLAQLSYVIQNQTKLEEWAAKTLDSWQFESGLELWKEAKNQKLESISAWFEAEQEAAVISLIKDYPCAYRISEPRKGERIPVALKNGRISRLFEPITKIFQLPHYHEFDLTPLIAVFYPVLFAYCLGDAGYGALMSLVAIIGLFSFLREQKPIAYLVLILGLSTTLMGLIKSGSLFGIALVPEHDIGWIASLSNLVIIPDDSSYFFNAFNVALLIGVLQILIGLIIAIVKAWYYDGFKHALSHWGKLFIVVGAVSLFMSDTLNLNNDAALALQSLLLVGVLLVMFFHDMNLKILSRIGGSVLPLFFIFTGLLGDVLSYVRLFALGVTSAVLGLVVNQIGMDMMGASVLSIIGASLFLVFGHSLNLVLAILGSFIHPLRLTFVEFYNNAQFEGGGIEFKPFQKSNRLKFKSHGNS